MPPAEAVRQWANLGYPRRALWLHRAAVEIRDRHDGVVPRDVDALLALTGIGDYTARAVAVFAYGDRHPVVDTNTRRVLARAIGQVAARSPARTGPRRDGRDPPPRRRRSRDRERGDHGTRSHRVHRARPRCEACPIAQVCAWRAAGYPDTGDDRRRQARYEGSDRQARGAVLKQLRDAVPTGSARRGDRALAGPAAARPGDRLAHRRRAGRGIDDQRGCRPEVSPRCAPDPRRRPLRRPRRTRGASRTGRHRRRIAPAASPATAASRSRASRSRSAM